MKIPGGGHGLSRLSGKQGVAVGAGKAGITGVQGAGPGVGGGRLGIQAAVGRAAAAVVAAAAVQDLAGGQLQPVVVARPDAATPGIQHFKGEGPAGRNGRGDRAVGLHRHVTGDLPKTEGAAYPVGVARNLEDIAVRNRHRLADAQESRRALAERGGTRAGVGADTAGRAVFAIEVVDTVDQQLALVGTGQFTVEVGALGHQVGVVARLRRDDLADQHPFPGEHHRPLGVLHRVVDPGPVQGRSGIGVVGLQGAGLVIAGPRRRIRVGAGVGIDNPAFAPGHQQPPGAVAQRVNPAVLPAAGAQAIGAYLGFGQ